MRDFYNCAQCGQPFSLKYAISDDGKLFCTYKCNTLWRAGISTPREREEAKAEDEEFERIAHFARQVV